MELSRPVGHQSELRSKTGDTAGIAAEPLPPSGWRAGLRLGLSFLALIYALLAGLKTVVDFDLGWQMASGRYLLRHHGVPRSEMFSYTAHGVEWIYPVLSGAI